MKGLQNTNMQDTHLWDRKYFDVYGRILEIITGSNKTNGRIEINPRHSLQFITMFTIDALDGIFTSWQLKHYVNTCQLRIEAQRFIKIAGVNFVYKVDVNTNGVNVTLGDQGLILRNLNKVEWNIIDILHSYNNYFVVECPGFIYNGRTVKIYFRVRSFREAAHYLRCSEEEAFGRLKVILSPVKDIEVTASKQDGFHIYDNNLEAVRLMSYDQFCLLWGVIVTKPRFTEFLIGRNVSTVSFLRLEEWDYWYKEWNTSHG